MNNYLKNIIFIIAGIAFYILWINGGEAAYGKFVATGIDKFITEISSIQKVQHTHIDKENKTTLLLTYSDRTNKISMEYCLPIILLLAWHTALFFDKRISTKYALKLLALNFILIYILQIIFPLLLFNISQSKLKSMGLFVGLQIFGFLIFFLILKDSLIIKYKFSHSCNN